DAAAITRILKGEAAVKEQAGGKVPSDGTCGKSIPDDSTPDGSTPDNGAPDNSTPDDGTPSGNATISFITGDDDDTILVAADGAALDGVSVWVDAGGGNDLVTVDSTGHIRMSLNAGAGDDRVVLASGIASMAARDIL